MKRFEMAARLRRLAAVAREVAGELRQLPATVRQEQLVRLRREDPDHAARVVRYLNRKPG